MGANSDIEWTDATWNPVRGCTRVSEGCRNCYAEVMAARFSGPGQWGEGFAAMKNGDHRWTGKVELIEAQLGLPLRWKKPRKIFVNSTSDLFHESLPDEAIDQVFAGMALCSQHTFQILTKRPDRMRDYLSPMRGLVILNAVRGLREAGNGVTITPAMYRTAADRLVSAPLPNVWLGTSVEDQDRADERMPHLLATPAAVRFLSCEPLLGPIDLTRIEERCSRSGGPPSYVTDALSGVRESFCTGAQKQHVGPINWVIVGGESGPSARPMHPDWARSLRDQCSAAGTPFFFKQWGEWREFDTGPELMVVYNDSDIADDQFSKAIRPGFITRDGKFIAKRANLPEEIPCRLMECVGKARAGRLLDGWEWSDFPQVAA